MQIGNTSAKINKNIQDKTDKNKHNYKNNVKSWFYWNFLLINATQIK